ncbi:Smr/MutS family protein [uncultured Sphaerochaeta sp.]|uniref:Smr/MutS family protein n=1 Tax=uncultured Sphaerochaeta sp. TaxID=886478 RepID=UPI002AA69AA9|nr:Smr/MutS family protein [uncultured Sphaerochaeta sp.]
MPKKKKKKTSDTSETAGNSRLVVDSDAYKPFEHIKEVKKQPVKQKQPAPKKQPTSQRKEPLVLGYDPKANFGDILATWEQTGELGGVTKRMKSHSKVAVEKSFGEILAEWEGEKQAAKNKKEEPVSIKKSETYVPKKDFASLLEEFEGSEKPKKKRGKLVSDQRRREREDLPLQPTHDMQEALDEKEELDQERDSSVSWSFADTYKQWTTLSDEEAAIKRAQKEKREAKADPHTISALRAMEPQSTLDLHGMKVLEAEQATADFLRSAKEQQLLKVAIITGKGLHNDKGYSLLKEAALSQIRISKVVREAYTPKAQYGGSGAIWIIMKR